MSKSILIVDEDPAVLTFLTLLFEERGVRVLRARSRAEMLAILERNYVPVDLVLANTVIAELSCSDPEQDVATHRGYLPLLRMSAFVEAGVIRVEVRALHGASDGAPSQLGVVETVLAALGRNRLRAHA